MNLLTKLSIVLAIGGVAGGGWHQVRAGHRHEEEIARLNQRIASQRVQIQQLRQERDEFLARAAEPLPPPAPAFATGDASFDSRMESNVARVGQLRKWLDENPRWKIPELQFLRDSDWFETVVSQSKFSAPQPASSLRTRAIRNMSPLILGALKSYEEANQGQLPTEISQLAPFFVSPIDEAILQRYEMRATGLAADVRVGLPIIGEKAFSIPGPEEEAMIFTGHGVEEEWLPFSLNPSAEMRIAISKAYQAFRVANKESQQPPAAAKLLPYFQNPEDATKFAKAQPAASVQSEPSSEAKAKEALSLAHSRAFIAYSASHNGIWPDKEDAEAVLPYFENPQDGEKWKSLHAKPEAGDK